MRVLAFRVAPYDNGTYVLADESGDALVIDPAEGEREVLAAVREHGLRVVEILNTHGHGDHVHDNAAVKAATGARLAIHRLDAYRLAPPFRVPPCEPDDLIDEGSLTFIRDLDIQALHTPGHTEGSTCFYLPAQATFFSGDTLFAGTYGRVDLPGGDAAAMARSLARLAALPPETAVFPGHGAPTVMNREIPWISAVSVRR